MHMQSPTPARTRIVAAERKTSPFALAIFLVAYIAMLAIVLAPSGTFISQSGAAQSQSTR